jgi:hypothetical protein
MARFKIRPCGHCGKQFQKTHHRQIYCSMPCRFWAKVDVRGPDECWPWQGRRTKFGHGQFSEQTGEPMKYAHRVSYKLTKGDPSDFNVCHRCDNPPCCNQGHLFLGDQKVNMSDCAAKGRSVRGEAHLGSKLNAEKVVAIRVDPRGNKEIAAEYGIAAPTVSKIKKRQRWAHI